MRRTALPLLLFCMSVTLLSQTALPGLASLDRMASRLTPVKLHVDTSHLSPGDQKAAAKLVEAARVIDRLYMQQAWSGNLALYAKLQKDQSPLGKARLRYFWLNKGPWSDLDGHQAFLPDVPAHKPAGANYYPENITKAEFEAWAKGLPEAQRKEAEGFFTVIRRDGSGKLKAVPYSEEYKTDLTRLAGLLRDAAALTTDVSLKHFLTLRAAAFDSDDYYASDIAWMDMNSPVDITIGPYETYLDEIFGYKAAFEAYVNIRDDAESAKVKFFADHLQDVENHLPIDPRYRNPKLGSSAPISVVNEIIATGDGAHGVRTAAYNLPNDERVINQKGSKRVMLKNVQEAKFEKTLTPIAKRVLPAKDQGDLSFDAFFTHILAHELSHGIGPHQMDFSGRSTSPRLELKDLYSAIEEAKADITGLFMLQHLYDTKQMPGGGEATERKMYTSFLASSFRTLRFGLNEAHGKGMALQFNYLTDKGAFVRHADGTYGVEFGKIKGAVRDLTHDLLTLEATGDYTGAKALLARLVVIRPELQKTLEGLQDLPTDINPEEPR